ncbi:MAG: hypothetical protein HC844_00820 [Tabrizicola sp.]|nr:hypothetical protein [Tabrizicola sp.]
MRYQKLTTLAVASCVFAGAAVAAFAQDVTLTTIDGTYSLVGELTDFNDKTVTIRTSVGTMSVARDSVTCAGAACPEGMAPLPRS